MTAYVTKKSEGSTLTLYRMRDGRFEWSKLPMGSSSGVPVLKGDPTVPVGLVASIPGNPSVQPQKPRLQQGLKTANVMERIKLNNEFIGSLRGKIVVVLATGPMFRRERIGGPRWMQELSNKADVYRIGVNGFPAICTRMLNIPANRVLDAVVAMDISGPICLEWGWEALVEKLCFTTSTKLGIFAQKWSSPTRDLLSLYSPNSVCGAINLALIGLATDTYVETLYGMHIRRVRKVEGGRILLLGVEHNRFDHAYSDNAMFKLFDSPQSPWPNMEEVVRGYETINRYAEDLGARVYNGAPWATVDMFEKVDAEEYLSIRGDRRVGLSRNPPEVVQGAYGIEECVRHLDKLAGRITGGFADDFAEPIVAAKPGVQAGPDTLELELTDGEEFICPILARRVIDEFAEAGGCSLVLGGRGDPLLHPEFNRFAWYAVRRGIRDVTISTPGLLVGPYAQRIVDSEVHRVIITNGASAGVRRLKKLRGSSSRPALDSAKTAVAPPKSMKVYWHGGVDKGDTFLSGKRLVALWEEMCGPQKPAGAVGPDPQKPTRTVGPLALEV